MDVVISSGWRSSSSTISMDPIDEHIVRPAGAPHSEIFVSKHGRFEITLSKDGEGWVVQYTSTGRLFGPREVIYSARHIVARHAAWDVMCRVIRATNDEQLGVEVGKQAAAWLQARRTVC
jgi:hypothetical protein